MVKYFTKKTQNLPVKQERKALAELKPVFSEKRMMATIKYLASDELKGRGIETNEINIAAEYIQNKFKEAGLKPIGKENSYYQYFTHTFKEKGKLKLKNVIGIIPGTDRSYLLVQPLEFKKFAILIIASLELFKSAILSPSPSLAKYKLKGINWGKPIAPTKFDLINDGSFISLSIQNLIV